MVDDNSLRPADPSAVGPWRIVARIGAGGMGVVYRATREGRVAAVKVIRPGLLDDAANRARFAREIQVLRTVRDVHISEFLAADLEGEPPWLATAFVEGASLRDEVARHGPLPEARWWAVARGLAQALAVLDVHGVIHRDIKPGNVILAPDRPVLIDFGIAVSEEATSLTATGLVTGSASWLSPEQAELKPVTIASDVFSLGSLLAFAGSGRPPFGQGSPIPVLAAIATKEPDLSGLTTPQISLVRAMLSKDPVDRPTPRQLLDRVKRPPSGTPDVPDPSPEVVTTPVIPAPATALGATRDSSPPQGRAPGLPPATHQRERPRRFRGSVLLWTVVVALLLVVTVGGLWWSLSRDPAASDGLSSGSDQSSAATPSARPTDGPSPSIPPAPVSDQLVSGEWALASYRLTNDAGLLGVAGTLRNNSTNAASGDVTVYVFVDGEYVGSATGRVTDVPPGGTTEVALTGSDAWRPGQQTLLVDVTER
ncbi:MAG: protein kinase [Actinobacteria bacterium]|nr:protein kinase [Actinomycetota bacterium]